MRVAAAVLVRRWAAAALALAGWALVIVGATATFGPVALVVCGAVTMLAAFLLDIERLL